MDTEVTKDVERRRPPANRRRRRKKKKKKKLTFLSIIGRIGALVGTTLLGALLLIIVVLFVVMRGPSPDAAVLFARSANETSAMKWVPRLYISKAAYDEILNPTAVEDGFKELPPAPVSVAANDTEVSEEEMEALTIVELKGATYKGILMIVRDPARVKIGAIDTFGGVGIPLVDYLTKYNAIACTNAGGFEDVGGTGKGGTPDGMVIQDGKLVFGNAGQTYGGVVGFDADHILHVGRMTPNEALAMGIVNGTSFSNGPILIKDGVRQTGFSSGINPRTCIGQTADGSILLVAVEGRMADSIGATYSDLADIMEEYGAINASNLDGGSSSGIYYEGERLTRSSSVIGDRPLPTAVVVGYSAY